MQSFIAAIILLIIVTSVILYLIHQKRKGVKCSGCPYAKQCLSKSNNTNIGCGCSEK